MNLLERVSSMSGRVAVVGDIMLDKYTYGVVSRISPEAPIPIVEKRGTEFKLGGAANVANNIKELGGNVALFGVVGDDHESQILRQMLKRNNIKDEILVDKNRVTTKKYRILAHNQHVVRIDSENTKQIDDAMVDKLVNSIGDFDCIVISDYSKGVVTKYLYESLTKKFTCPIICDPKKDLGMYPNSFIITPNLSEFRKFTGREASDADINDEDINAANSLMDKFSIKNILVTKGDKGMTLFDRNNILHIQSEASDVMDITGAGDTVVAALSLGIASGIPVHESARIANYAAGISVTKVGTYAVKKSDLIDQLRRIENV